MKKILADLDAQKPALKWFVIDPGDGEIVAAFVSVADAVEYAETWGFMMQEATR